MQKYGWWKSALLVTGLLSAPLMSQASLIYAGGHLGRSSSFNSSVDGLSNEDWASFGWSVDGGTGVLPFLDIGGNITSYGMTRYSDNQGDDGSSVLTGYNGYARMQLSVPTLPLFVNVKGGLGILYRGSVNDHGSHSNLSFFWGVSAGYHMTQNWDLSVSFQQNRGHGEVPNGNLTSAGLTYYFL